MTSIVVRTSFEGIHCYPSAPDEVAYLRQMHRHVFGVCVELEVFTDDRELEFIMVKHIVDEFLSTKMDPNDRVWHMGRLSCEQVANMVAKHLYRTLDRSGKRYCAIVVDEDGENGAKVEYKQLSQLALDGGMDFVKENPPTSKEVFDNMAIKAGIFPLSFAKYQNDAYMAIQDHDNAKEEIMHWAIGLGEEAGEALSVVKHKYYGGQYSVEEMVGELGDVLWHVAALCTALGIDMEDVAEYNLAKLTFRYPEGKFDEGRSQARHELERDFNTSEQRNQIVSKIKRKMEEKQNNA